jgi:hypothetical protein
MATASTLLLRRRWVLLLLLALLCVTGVLAKLAGEQRREFDRSSEGWDEKDKCARAMLFRVSGFVWLREWEKTLPWRPRWDLTRGAAGGGVMVTAGASMFWSWERIFGSKMGPWWRTGVLARGGVVAPVQTESAVESTVDTAEYTEARDDDRVCEGASEEGTCVLCTAGVVVYLYWW